MTPEQICALLNDDYLQFLALEGKLVGKRADEDALVFLFQYAELFIEVFFSLDDGKLMGSATLQNQQSLLPYHSPHDATHMTKARQI